VGRRGARLLAFLTPSRASPHRDSACTWMDPVHHWLMGVLVGTIVSMYVWWTCPSSAWPARCS